MAALAVALAIRMALRPAPVRVPESQLDAYNAYLASLDSPRSRARSAGSLPESESPSL